MHVGRRHSCVLTLELSGRVSDPDRRAAARSLPGVAFHRTSATLRTTGGDGVWRVGVKAIKSQPSVKLAPVVHEVKNILLSKCQKISLQLQQR